MGHSHSLPHLQCCSLAHERLALEMASLQVKAALVVQNHILSCQPTWTSAIRWSDTSFQDNQQLFGSIISLKHTHKHRERERETYRQEKSIKNPLPPLGGLLKVSDLSFHVSLHWSLTSCMVTFNLGVATPTLSQPKHGRSVRGGPVSMSACLETWNRLRSCPLTSVLPNSSSRFV